MNGTKQMTMPGQMRGYADNKSLRELYDIRSALRKSATKNGDAVAAAKNAIAILGSKKNNLEGNPIATKLAGDIRVLLKNKLSDNGGVSLEQVMLINSLGTYSWVPAGATTCLAERII